MFATQFPPTTMLQKVVGKGHSSGLLSSLRSVKKVHQLRLLVLPIFLSAALLTWLVFLASFKLSALGLSLGGHSLRLLLPAATGGGEGGGNPRIPRELAMALLHFATTSEVPQQSKEEISEVLSALQERAPCNFLVYGMWHDSLLWASFNHGGRTVFLDESQDWIDRHPLLESYKVDYSTRLGEADSLLEAARDSRAGECRPHQPLQSSACPLALSRHLPQELLALQWDLILIDGPRSYKNASFPGRMSPIFTSSVMARTRTAPGHVDVFLHDATRPTENQYAQEFLCLSNVVNKVGDLWHFQIWPSRSTRFCS